MSGRIDHRACTDRTSNPSGHVNSSGPPVLRVISAFDDWLARRDVPARRRRRYHSHVERYLRHRGPGSAADTSEEYLARLGRDGARIEDLALAGTSLALFRRYRMTGNRASAEGHARPVA